MLAVTIIIVVVIFMGMVSRISISQCGRENSKNARESGAPKKEKDTC